MCSWILDVVIGDPPHWPHPVRWIGRLIAVSQRVVRRVCHSDRALRIGGGVMWLVVIGLTWGGTGVLALAHGIHPWMAGGSVDDLHRAGGTLSGTVGDGGGPPLQAGDPPKAGISSRIVGRDTSQLQPAQINRAVVETVAENTVDGIIAPLFSCSSARAANIAVNTLDSMVGYKHENTGRSAWSALVLMM
ncbi:cobalamin biosynthesis protein [Klebsiella pneumoniae]|uniref:Cobalamin biosynthesis protein n=1 Tax=Klebsiella pneumoniae TaxID=573 RepID=A0A939SUP3_KLEPN|nr:cobalamin biosynthesis protein [Klebsiella pneumoniae]